MNKGPTIAIDGPAGSGKSTVARCIAERLGYLYLDSGAMYRAVTLLAVRQGVSPVDVPALIRLAQNCQIDFANNGKTTLLNGEDVSDAIRTPEINRIVSDVSKIPQVRQEIVKQQCRIGENGRIVAEGRDVTTVVFPDADFKFFFDASIEERAKRRLLEFKAKGIDCNMAQVTEELRLRDEKDRSREHSPLREAEDAIVVDTTGMTVDQVIDFAIGYLREH